MSNYKQLSVRLTINESRLTLWRLEDGFDIRDVKDDVPDSFNRLSTWYNLSAQETAKLAIEFGYHCMKLGNYQVDPKGWKRYRDDGTASYPTNTTNHKYARSTFYLNDEQSQKLDMVCETLFPEQTMVTGFVWCLYNYAAQLAKEPPDPKGTVTRRKRKAGVETTTLTIRLPDYLMKAIRSQALAEGVMPGRLISDFIETNWTKTLPAEEPKYEPEFNTEDDFDHSLELGDRMVEIDTTIEADEDFDFDLDVEVDDEGF